jgi:hypothetical protein
LIATLTRALLGSSRELVGTPHVRNANLVALILVVCASRPVDDCR